jgi:putative N6-adenine-specific DNA methylase
MTADQLRCFAITAPGLEAITLAELGASSIRGIAEPGGVAWDGSVSSVALANLWSRTPSRIVVRAAEFNARTFHELERHARQVPWERFVAPGAPVSLRVTCKKSALYHSGAVAQRLVEAMAHRLGAAPPVTTAAAPDDAEEGGTPTTNAPSSAQLFVVRVFHDRVTISADASGELLHKRGYRLASGKAPLRETLAAALLLGAGWRGDTPLVDPMCGSGTIPIEGAMIARRIAPGAARSFAFLSWPDADGDSWARLREHAVDQQLPKARVDIVGADRDAGAIEASRANADRAGVLQDIELREAPVSALACSGDPGLIATNPPYGVRVGDEKKLRDLYARFGSVARASCAGWTVAMVVASRTLEAQTGLEFAEVAATRNGGIPVRLLVAGSRGRST